MLLRAVISQKNVASLGAPDTTTYDKQNIEDGGHIRAFFSASQGRIFPE